MKIFEIEFPDLPGRNPDINPNKGKRYQTGVAITRDQIEGFKEWPGVDVKALVNSALINEIYQSISNKISKLVFEKESTEIEFNNVDAVFNFIKTNNAFILTNVKLGSFISNQLKFKPVKLDLPFLPGSVYKLGILKNIDVYVDPNLRWDDERLAIVYNNFWNWKPLKITKQTKDIVIVPKMIIEMKLNTKDVISDVYKINNLKI